MTKENFQNIVQDIINDGEIPTPSLIRWRIAGRQMCSTNLNGLETVWRKEVLLANGFTKRKNGRWQRGSYLQGYEDGKEIKGLLAASEGQRDLEYLIGFRDGVGDVAQIS